MERMKKMFESMAGMVGEKEKEKWMEKCLTFLEGEWKDKDRERDDKKKEETGHSPDRVAGGSPVEPRVSEREATRFRPSAASRSRFSA